MGCRDLDITIFSGKGLKYVKHISKMEVYAVVKISGDPDSEHKTHVDKDGGANPTWDFPVLFTINEASARRNNQMLIFELRCARTIRGDKDIGEVQVPLKELLDNTVNGRSAEVVRYPVNLPSGGDKGELKFSYKFSNPVVSASAIPVASHFLHTCASYPPAGYPSSGQPPVGYPSTGQPPYMGPYTPSVGPSALFHSFSAPQYGYQVVQPEWKTEQQLNQEALLEGLTDAVLAGELVYVPTATTGLAADYDTGLAADYDTGLAADYDTGLAADYDVGSENGSTGYHG